MEFLNFLWIAGWIGLFIYWMMTQMTGHNPASRISSMDRALRYERRGWGFESLILHNNWSFGVDGSSRWTENPKAWVRLPEAPLQRCTFLTNT